MKYPVDIEKAERTVDYIKKYSDQIGGYGGEYKHKTQNFFGNLLACVDGVGTKILTAQYAQRKYNRDISSLGIDCVAMVVNDMICKGADPLFFLDYYASSKLDEWSFYQIIDGIHMGCEEAGMQLLGGETAEMNGVIEQGTFDVCGFGVGEIINELPYNVSKGDVVIGLFSHGLHSNGFSLINTADLDQYDEQFINTLLTPTKIYFDEVKKIRHDCVINALAHITGGGLSNIDRVIPNNLKVKYLMSEGYFDHVELFNKIQTDFDVEYQEMRNTFNCGVGMVVIMHPEELTNMPHKDFIILGELIETES